MSRTLKKINKQDLHNNQIPRLERQFTELDDGLEQLKLSLGKTWNNTVVVVATEFGRTVKENGTGGTDHGTASALFIAGGAVNGGTVAGKWPGLANEQLFKGRDLMPTTNSFSWIAGILMQHWNFTEQEITTEVFPQVKIYEDKLIKSYVT